MPVALSKTHGELWTFKTLTALPRLECSHSRMLSVSAEVSMQLDPATCSCENCGKKFRRAYNLRSHTRAAHSDERPFVCTVCGEGFKRPFDRRRHQRLHSGEQNLTGP